MKYFISGCIAVFCVLAVVLLIASADEHHMGKCDVTASCGKMSHEMGNDSIFFHKAHVILENTAELGLTNEQVEKIKSLKYSVEKSLIKEEADIKTLALDIKEALGKDEVDIAAVNKLIDQKYTLKAQKTKEEIGAYVNLKKILTPEQLKKLKEMHQHGMKGCQKEGAERKGKGSMAGKEERHEEMPE